MLAFGDRVAPRHAELIDTAVGLAFDADDLVKLRGVEVDRRRRCGAAGGASGVLLDCKRLEDSGRHLRRIAMAADMHVEGRRVAAQHMIVDRGDLESVLDQLCS